MQLITIRVWQVKHMEDAIKSFEHFINNANPSDLTTYRDGGTGWTVLEVLCHLRDYEEIFMLRARMTMEQDNPDLPAYDPDTLAAERRYMQQDIRTVLGDWKRLRAEYIAYLNTREEADWERPAQHPTRGHFTLHDQFFLIAQHDMLHFEQATRILAEKRKSA